MLKLIKSLVAAIIFVHGIMVPSAVMAIEIGQTLPLERIQTLDGTYFEISKNNMRLHQPFSKEGCTIFVKTGHLLG